ncbi:MAG TPA: hypothetical protein VHT73_10870 [Thermodesulfobacteriota bacterium]|nr:hypothetical protein [Thermodesulfobacteriota bacterium]
MPKLEGLTIEYIKKEFSSKYEPLPLGSRGVENIEYEGRHLFTGEIVEPKLGTPLKLDILIYIL